jgi:hypothetical protein
MKVLHIPAAMVLLAVFMAGARAADIIWASDITDANGADVGFVDLLTTAGHTVTRVDTPGTLGDTDIAQLNGADLVIVGRANGSGQFQDDNGVIWNAQVTAPVIAMSGYVVRDNRMRWVAGDDLPDSGPAKLRAEDPAHPIFAGVSLDATNMMVDDYNVMIDRGTSTNTNVPVGGTVIAWNPTVSTNGVEGVAVAEWPAGATVGGDQALAGFRMLFNAGSREADGAGVPDAGVLDLTDAGQQLFLNAVDYTLAVPEPSSAMLLAGGLLMWAARRRR